MEAFWDRRAKQFLVISGSVLLLFATLKLAKYFADVLIVVGISILIAYLLIGPVDLLTRVVRFRAIAVLLVYFILIGLIVAAFIFIAPKIGKEFGEFTKQIPLIITHIDLKVHNLQTYLNKNNIPINLTSAISGLKSKFSNFSLDPLNNILGVARGTFHVVFYILVTAVTSYYFLLDGHRIVKEFTKHIPSKYQQDIHTLVTELDKCLRGFYGGMVKVASINALVMFITYLTMKLPYAMLLALWHFLACIIPAVGGWIGLIPALTIIAFTAPLKIWIPIAIYEAYTRFIQDNLVVPNVMKDAIGIHPVLVLIAILAGFKTGGLVGVLFALPIFGVINVILKYSLEKLGET